MRRVLSILLIGVVCTGGLVLTGLSSRLAGQDGTTPAASGDDLAALRRKVLADPTDRAVVEKLDALRRRQRRIRLDALDALHRGLRAYLAKDLVAAGTELRKAAASPDVTRLADSFLLKRLEQMIAECPVYTSAGKPPDATPCRMCGDTGLKDCQKCTGSGAVRCPKCRGKGTRAGSSPRTPRVPAPAPGRVVCEKCGGTGVVVCEKCRGTGVVPCHLCTRKPSVTAAAELGPNAIEAIRKVICMARYLREGGVDLYATGALTPAADVLKKP